MKTLVTGFENFLDHPYNPSQKVLDSLVVHEGELITEILPVDFDSANKKIVSLILEHQPQVHLSLGLAASRTLITPEVVALNMIHNPQRPDNRGQTHSLRPIHPEGQDLYWSTLPLRKLEQELKLTLSFSAGTYVCNSVMYCALEAIAQNKLNCLSGFIHIPPDQNFHKGGHAKGGLSLDQIAQSLNQIIELCTREVTLEHL